SSDESNDGSGGTTCTGGGDSGSDAGANCPVLPDPICSAGTKWTPGTAAFVEATEKWGLTGVEGQRLTVTDLDGDGRPDLVVRRVGVLADDFGPGGKRNIWLLKNTGSGKFEDVTQDSGFLVMRTDPNGTLGRPGEIIVFGDVDNDGDLDG